MLWHIWFVIGTLICFSQFLQDKLIITTLLKIDVFYRQSIMIYWLLLCSCIPQQSVLTVVIWFEFFTFHTHPHNTSGYRNLCISGFKALIDHRSKHTLMNSNHLGVSEILRRNYGHSDWIILTTWAEFIFLINCLLMMMSS